MSHPFRRGSAAAALVMLTGACATPEPEAAFQAVQQTTRERPGHDLRWQRNEAERQAAAQQVQALLAQPLTADTAVQLALLNHRGLQAALATLGISEAEIAQAGGLHLDLARPLTPPWAAELQARRRPQVQARVALRVLTHAADTRKAWVQAVAAEEGLRHRRRVLQAAEAGAELARRMVAAGNFSPLQQAREQMLQAEAQATLARAEQARLSTRERLARLLGLWGDQAAFTLPERLPELPAEPPDSTIKPDIERIALERRLDVQSARAAATQALHHTAQVAVDARSELREAQAQLQAAWALARHHRNELLPLHQRIAEQNLLRYNGMQIGVFELLAGAREQILAEHAALDALRDFWLARADLDLALVGRPLPNESESTP